VTGAGGSVAALVRRDAQIFFSYRLQVVMRLVSALFLVVGLFFMDRTVGDAPALGAYGGRYFEFALIGFVLLYFVEVGLGAFTDSLAREQQTGTLEVLLSTPNRLATVLGGLLVFPVLNVTAMVGIYLVSSVVLLDARFAVGGILPGLVVLALTLACFTGIGAMSGGLSILVKRGDPIGAIVAQATTLLGGALFPTTVLPSWLQTLAVAFPPYHALVALRATFIEGASLLDVLPQVLILAAFASVLLTCGLWVFGRASRYARVLGTLGNY
jgi:ABC-2 type transport system permease protein